MPSLASAGWRKLIFLSPMRRGAIHRFVPRFVPAEVKVHLSTLGTLYLVDLLLAHHVKVPFARSEAARASA
jgi:hypothetical protein